MLQISVAEAHNRLSHLLRKVNDGPITITKRGKPVGILISPADYERLRKYQAYQQMLGLSRALRESGLTAEELVSASRSELEARP
jgi:prevent-host-death family protein